MLRRIVFAVVSSLIAAAPAVADPLEDRRLWLSFGGFEGTFDTQLGVQARSVDADAEVGLEDDFGLAPRERILRIDAAFHLADRHRISASWFEARRDHSAVIERSIPMGDETLDLAVAVDGGFGVEVSELAYRYAMWITDRSRGEFIVGIHRLELDADVRAALIEDPSIDGSASGRAEGPLPLLGLAWYQRFGERWRAELVAQAMDAKVDEYDGRVLDLRAGIVFQLTRNLELGLSYTRFDFDLDVERKQWRGTLDFDYRGPQVNLALVF